MENLLFLDVPILKHIRVEFADVAALSEYLLWTYTVCPLVFALSIQYSLDKTDYFVCFFYLSPDYDLTSIAFTKS